MPEVPTNRTNMAPATFATLVIRTQSAGAAPATAVPSRLRDEIKLSISATARPQRQGPSLGQRLASIPVKVISAILFVPMAVCLGAATILVDLHLSLLAVPLVIVGALFGSLYGKVSGNGNY